MTTFAIIILLFLLFAVVFIGTLEFTSFSQWKSDTDSNGQTVDLPKEKK